MKKILTTPNDTMVYFPVFFWKVTCPQWLLGLCIALWVSIFFLFSFFNFMHVFSKTNEHPSHFLSLSCAPSIARVKRGKGKTMPCTVESTRRGDSFRSLAFIYLTFRIVGVCITDRDGKGQLDWLLTLKMKYSVPPLHGSYWMSQQQKMSII